MPGKWSAAAKRRVWTAEHRLEAGRAISKGITKRDRLRRSRLMKRKFKDPKFKRMMTRGVRSQSKKELAKRMAEWNRTETARKTSSEHCLRLVGDYFKKNPSSLERKFLKRIREEGCKLRIFRQKAVKKLRTVVDFYIPSRKLFIYVDGDYWHRNRRIADLFQAMRLKDLGFNAVRVKEKTFEKDLKALIRRYNLCAFI